MHTPCSISFGLPIAAISALCLAAHPAQAQTTLPFSGDYASVQTGFTQITPTTEEDMLAFTSTNASFGLNSGVADYFLTDAFPGAELTPNTASTFDFTATDGSTLYGIFTSNSVTVSGQTQFSTSSLEVTGGTGIFQGAAGSISATGQSTLNGDSATFRAIGTIIVPAAVPEASATVSLGLLLSLGLVGTAVAARKKKATA